MATDQVSMLAHSGSFWTTRQERVQRGWPDVGPPDNFREVADGAGQWASFQASVRCQPREHGDQAGLYAMSSEDGKEALSWVKLVVEGGGGSDVNLVFAEQHDGKPFMRGKKRLDGFAGSIDLKMFVDGTACYRLGGSDWLPVLRGMGWMMQDELGDRGPRSLEDTDARANDRAIATLPGPCRACIAAEQWHATDTIITFENVTFAA